MQIILKQTCSLKPAGLIIVAKLKKKSKWILKLYGKCQSIKKYNKIFIK